MNKRKRSTAQLAVWLLIGSAALVFLKWQNDDIDRDAAAPIPSMLDSGVAPATLESIPKPFARLKAPIILAPRKAPDLPIPKKLRAEPGQPVPVSITAYCLKGRTRIGTAVSDGVVAADPRVFSLGSEIVLVVGKDTLGRFRVEDTGLLIKGRKVDVWLADCTRARAFGRKRGQATLALKSHR